MTASIIPMPTRTETLILRAGLPDSEIVMDDRTTRTLGQLEAALRTLHGDLARTPERDAAAQELLLSPYHCHRRAAALYIARRTDVQAAIREMEGQLEASAWDDYNAVQMRRDTMDAWFQRLERAGRWIAVGLIAAGVLVILYVAGVMAAEAAVAQAAIMGAM